jgi:carbamoyl-phosphate synthase small subunit
MTNDAQKTPPQGATAVLVLADGQVFWGSGIGAAVTRVGEVCFNTSLTGYQEIMTDPSYAGQLITFTFPHIGNVGTNHDDIESQTPAALGLISRAEVTEPSNHRAQASLNDWLQSHQLPGITGIDTRRLTRHIRDHGAPSGALQCNPEGQFDIAALQAQAANWPGLAGMDLAITVSCQQSYVWDEGTWQFGTVESADGYKTDLEQPLHVVAMDFGAKRNILRNLAHQGCRITVVPADCPADTILGLNPDGIFLANGPGDPAATGDYAVPTIKRLVDSGKPIFGICLGHQMLALSYGATTKKMALGHRGGNHPVQDLTTGKVEITSQNHGFVVCEEDLPASLEVTHRSLFDGSIEGLQVIGKPIFSVQYHPEASPGPSDSNYLFARFTDLIKQVRG